MELTKPLYVCKIQRIYLPMQETQEMLVWSLGLQDPLEEEMATHPSILGWKILWATEPGRRSQSWLSTYTSTILYNFSNIFWNYILSLIYKRADVWSILLITNFRIAYVGAKSSIINYITVPWVGKIPWRREQLQSPGFWHGEFHGLYSPQGCKESDTTEWLSLLYSSHFANGKIWCSEINMLVSVSGRNRGTGVGRWV